MVTPLISSVDLMRYGSPDIALAPGSREGRSWDTVKYSDELSRSHILTIGACRQSGSRLFRTSRGIPRYCENTNRLSIFIKFRFLCFHLLWLLFCSEALFI